MRSVNKLEEGLLTVYIVVLKSPYNFYVYSFGGIIMENQLLITLFISVRCKHQFLKHYVPTFDPMELHSNYNITKLT